MASLKTRGTVDGNDLVIEGQKIWCSFADIADYQELLVRTDPREVHAWRWISPQDLQSELDEPGTRKFTPWFRMEWERIWREHRADLAALA